MTAHEFLRLMAERRAAAFSKLVTMLHAGAENSCIVNELIRQQDEIRKCEMKLETKLITEKEGENDG
jgi:hypothetical protein